MASSETVVTAVDALGTHHQFQRGDAEDTRRALGRAEASVIQMLQGLHDLRVAVGDAEEE